VLKPQLQKAVLEMADMGANKTDLLSEDFDFEYF